MSIRTAAGTLDVLVRRRGTIFNSDDYPNMLDGLFGRKVSYLTIEPPNRLMALQTCPVRRGLLGAGIRNA